MAEHTLRASAKRQTRTDLTERRGGLVNCDFEPLPTQRERGCEAAKSGPDDQQLHGLGPRLRLIALVLR